MGIKLKDYQEDAIKKMKNGCILCGGVGSGKSITSLAYYFFGQGGRIEDGRVFPMINPIDIYIITTARKRDTREWEMDMCHFLLSPDPEINSYSNKVVVDSWNNIKKYENVTNAFFIFDEQRVVGSGAWVKAFLKITKENQWILLSATPGDTWMDYVPVFVANGFFRNKSDFIRNHVVYSRYSKFPKVDRYVNLERLTRLRDKILVDMNFQRSTVSHNEDILCDYDTWKYKDLQKNRFNYDKGEPIQNASELCYELRKIVNSSPARLNEVFDIVVRRGKVIIFYNFDYELELLLNLFNQTKDISVAEWNGHKHQPIPETDKWVYLVQYNAGNEGWNCIKTDTIVFFSQNYSYKVMVQAAGRIDRMNTPYKDLYYYHLKSRSPIDIAIARALKNKKSFNERKFVENR